MLFSALAALAAAVPSRAGQAAAPLPSSPGDARELDCLFDGGCRARSEEPGKLPIRLEEKTPPNAPRYALDLKAVPRRFLNIIPGYELLPHKNQEETPGWVEHVNRQIRAKNERRRSDQILEWVYDGRPNEPPFSCLSYGISTVLDWWTLQCGSELPSYRSSNHGGLERGWDPRLFELEYFYRASTKDPYYAMFSRYLPIERDPVRQNATPYSPLGYAEIAVENRAYANPDPYTDEIYRYSPGRNPLEGQYLQLFSNRLLRARTPDRYARVLAEAVDKWGIAFVQLEETKRPRAFGAHAINVIGYFCMEPDGRYLQCPDNKSEEDWGRTAYFVVHDSFGDFPADKIRDASGGSAYRAVRIGSVDEAYVFPHSLRVTARPLPGREGAWSVTVTNRCGRPMELERAQVSAGRIESAGRDGFTLAGAAQTAVGLELAVKHYYEADGRPRVFRIQLDASKSTEGEEIRRTPDSKTFYERRGETAP